MVAELSAAWNRQVCYLSLENQSKWYLKFVIEATINWYIDRVDSQQQSQYRYEIASTIISKSVFYQWHKVVPTDLWI